MLPYELLPDPTPLGGDQPRGRAGAGRGLARRDDHTGGVRAARAVAPRLAKSRRDQVLSMTASSDTVRTIRSLSDEGYKYGFVTDIEADEAPPGLNEDTVRFISAKKEEPEWLLEWRLQAFRAWREMTQPDWAKLHVAPIDYQAATYYSAPRRDKNAPKSL